MGTNRNIDDRLSDRGAKLSGLTEEAAVAEALREYIHRRKQARVLELFGKINFDSEYDYKKARSRIVDVHPFSG